MNAALKGTQLNGIMKIRIHYTTQLKMALGIDSEEVVVPEESLLQDLLSQLKHQHPQEFGQYVLNAQGQLQSGVLLCVGNKHAGRDLTVSLQAGDNVTLLSVVSGG